MSVNYEFTAPSNDEEIFGIIKSKINDTFYPTYGISDMKDINFENPDLKLPYYRGYYLISEA